MTDREKKKLIIVIVFLAAVFWTAVVIWIVRSQSDQEKATEQIGETQKLVSTEEVELPSVEAEEVAAEGTSVKFLSVELDKLVEKNPDTVGWVQVVGTNINYPFVQAADNDYYRTHSFDKSYNTAGWPFLDAVNMKDLSDSHSIIYLHGKIEGSEFEPARSVIASTSWIADPENFMVRTSTEKADALWQVFSIYKIPATDDYLKISFKGDGELVQLVQMLKKRSVYKFEVPFSEADKMLTFSIKYDDEQIVAIHAKRVSIRNLN